MIFSHNKIRGENMNKAMKKAVGTLAVVGAGYGAWMMYKKQNPTAMEDLKHATRVTLRKTADMLDDTAKDM